MLTCAVCLWSACAWETKVVRREVRMNAEGEKMPMYLTHYSGWNKRYAGSLPMFNAEQAKGRCHRRLAAHKGPLGFLG